MKKKVLFVDDEPHVLGGLRRMLRPLQYAWDTGFATGGPQALATLEQEPFDIIVSDMRMPGMTGVQLLEEVGRRYPGMVRIILTGQCDEESGLRALRVAHQMLYKPCDAETLKVTIARTCALRDLLENETLQAVVTRQASMPCLPESYRQVLQELDAAAPSLDRVAAIISQDIGMVAKILHVVNSSFFGLRREVTNPKQAVLLLGLDTVRVLVLAVGIFSSCDAADHPQLRQLQSHSFAVSGLARAIAQSEGAETRVVEHAGMAGLLHDVGKLVLLHHEPTGYRKVLQEAAARNRPLWQVEAEAFGASHAEVGACLLGLWGMPLAMVEAIAWHHRPNDCLSFSFGPLAAVHVANSLCTTDRNGQVLDQAYLNRLQCRHRLATWSDLAHKIIEEAAGT